MTATSPGLQGARSATTAADGEFRLLALPPGTYMVRAGTAGPSRRGAPRPPIAQLADPRLSATNPDFLKKGALFTQPRSVRVGVRLKF